jgi:hypothetical protein
MVVGAARKLFPRKLSGFGLSVAPVGVSPTASLRFLPWTLPPDLQSAIGRFRTAPSGRAQHPPAATRSAPPPPQNQISHSERFGNPLSLNDPASSFCILHSAFCVSPPLVGTPRRAPAEGHHGDSGWPLRGRRIRVANQFPPSAFCLLPSAFWLGVRASGEESKLAQLSCSATRRTPSNATAQRRETCPPLQQSKRK